jgi:dihydroxyacetone kinase-like protein
MMSASIGYDVFVRMLTSSAEEIRRNHELLTKLDSVGGDGDHGTTMTRAMGLLEKTIKEASSPDMRNLLQSVGWSIMGVDGGAIGPLLGLFFAGMSDSAPTDSADAAALALMFESGLANLRKQTKAQPGDKTLIDALVPAVEAASASAASGGDVEAVLDAAAAASAVGAEKTKEYMAKFGRARSIKEQSIGSPDPGATSVSLIFKGFKEGVKDNA